MGRHDSHGFEDFIVQVSILWKVMYRFNAVPIKSQWYFSEIENLILKFTCTLISPQMTETVLKMSNRAGGLILLDVKTL
jgi:hypothetical protein